MPTLNAPALDGQDFEAPTFTQAKTLYAPAFDGQVRRAPSLTLATPATGLVVKAGTTVLDALSPTWFDELAGPGNFSITLENDDPDMPEFDDIVSFELDGHLRFAGPIRGKNVTSLAEGEEHDEVTVITGPGRLAITDKSLVPPSRGWDALPVEVTLSDSWMAADYDDSAWPYAKRIRRADIPVSFFPYRSTPEWWPDKGAYWVAPNRSDITTTDAPLGDWPIRSDPIDLDAGIIEILFSVNNLGPVFFDGALISDTTNAPGDTNRIRLEVSDGDHVIAARVTNYIRETGFIGSIWTVDADGLLDELVWSSDADNMRALPYPSRFPGTNAGISIRKRLEAIQAEGELTDLELDFTDLVDSDGQPWTTVAEITADAGRTLNEFLSSLTDWLADVQMAPGGNILRAWNWGTRGGTPGVTIAATTDRTTAEVPALSFDGTHIRANRIRFRYRYGYGMVDLSGSDPTVTAFLDLSQVRSLDTAESIVTNLMLLRKDPSYAGRLVLDPVSSNPYEDFDNGDTVTHPADPNGSTSSRVQSLTYSEDEETAERIWTLELHDVRQGDEERQENWLKRTAMGALAGGARVTTRSGDPLPPAMKVSTKEVAEFSFDGALTASTSPARPASSSGNLIEFYAHLTTAGSTSTQIRVLKNGVSLGTLTLAAGEDEGEFDLTGGKTYRNVDKYRVQIVSAGTGAEGLDVQVRAI